MSGYYKGKRSYNIFSPLSPEPFTLSRTKLELFIICPRCFYLDRRLGVGQPPGYPFSLNSAVDKLLKKEFDVHRADGTVHPLCEKYGINAKPLAHEMIDKWRDSLRGGIKYHHKSTNLIITGGVDDVWTNDQEEVIIVDYKCTAKDGEVNIDAQWQDGYKHQMEIYQWLFRQNGFKVSSTGYFVYCNGNTDKEAFDGRLEFEIKLIPYKGNDDWVESVVFAAKECLIGNKIPEPGENCDYCLYRRIASEAENGSVKEIPVPEL